MEQSMDCDEAPAALSQNGSWCASCPGRFAESVWHARMKFCTRCCELPRFLRSSFLDALIEPDCDLTTAWFLGPAGATGQLVHLVGFDSLKAAAKWDVKCRSSLEFCAQERRGPLTRGTLYPARFSKIKLLRSKSNTNRTRASSNAKATIAAIRMQRFVAQRTYKATLNDVPGPFDDRHCHRLARAGPSHTTAHS